MQGLLLQLMKSSLKAVYESSQPVIIERYNQELKDAIERIGNGCL